MISPQLFVIGYCIVLVLSGIVRIIGGAMRAPRKNELKPNYDTADVISGLLHFGIVAVLVMWP